MTAGTYAAVDAAGLAAILAALPAVRQRLGGEAPAWRIREVGDGNLNLVFIVEGEAGGVVVKQALPYVRMVGEFLALAAGALVVRIQRPDRAGPIRAAADAGGLPLRSRAGDDRHGVSPSAHRHAQRPDSRRPLSPICLRHRRIPRRDPVQHVGARGLRRRTQGAGRAVRAEHGDVQDHRRPRLHRPVPPGAAQPLEPPASRRAQAGVRERRRAQDRRAGAQIPVHDQRPGADPRRPAHRLDHGHGDRDAGHRPRIRLHRADRLRCRRGNRQSPARLLLARRASGVAARARRATARGFSTRRRRCGAVSATASWIFGAPRPPATPISRGFSGPNRIARRSRRSGGDSCASFSKIPSPSPAPR